jgi:hypothetical protein
MFFAYCLFSLNTNALWVFYQSSFHHLCHVFKHPTSRIDYQRALNLLTFLFMYFSFLSIVQNALRLLLRVHTWVCVCKCVFVRERERGRERGRERELIQIANMPFGH